MAQKGIAIWSDAREIADHLADVMKETMDGKRGGEPLNIALSGGSTPKEIFDQLSWHHQKSLPWERIRFFQVDERCVPPDDPESNIKMLHAALFSRLDILPDHIFRICGEDHPESEAKRYGKILAMNLPAESEWPVFDLILLGLGEDGHTASLFPGDVKNLNSANCCEVAVHPRSGQKRITLTMPVINRAKQVVFLVTGPGKAEIVREIIQFPGKNRYPASQVRPVSGNLSWLLDSDASKMLNLES